MLSAPEFVAAVAALIGRPLGDSEPFAVAVSGGPDSLALLLLAHAAFGTRLRVLTVDHRLRAGSAAEAADVAAICAARGIAHAVLAWEGDKPAANLQANARAARYALMADWCAANGVGWLATAHHADDQAETLLMRLARGAGLGGLSGARAARPLGQGVTLLRPLLAARKAELVTIVSAAGLTAVDDPANRDPRHDRTQARALLRDTGWLDAARLAATARHLADAEAAIDWTVEAAWRSRVERDPLRVDAQGLPREIRRRLLVRALESLDPDLRAGGPEIDRALGRLDAGVDTTLGSVKARSGPMWCFEKAPPRRAGTSKG